MSEFLKKILFTCFSLMVLGFFLSPGTMASNRVYRTNTDYTVGDWISHTVTRFVNAAAQEQQFVYFATTGGIIRYDYWTKKWEFPWTSSNGLAENYILFVGHDPQTNILWCVTRISVSYLEPATQYWNNIYFDEMGLAFDESVQSLGIDPDEVWLSTSRARILSTDKFSIRFRFRFDQSQSQSDESDIVWYGVKSRQSKNLPHFFMSDGYLFNSEGYIDDLRLRVWPITCNLFDKWNNAWIGTWGLGTLQGNLATLRLELEPQGLFDPDVTTIARDKDGLWIGGLSTSDTESGITHCDRDFRSVMFYEPKYITGFNSGDVNEIAVDGDQVWIATQHGLSHYNKARNIWHTYFEVDHLTSNVIYDVAISDASIWAATGSGISRIEKATIGSDSIKVEWIGWNDLKHSEVYDVHIQDHLVWFGCEWGLYVYNTSQKKGGFFSGPDGAISARVTAVSAYGDEVWFGTKDQVEAFNIKLNAWLPSPARRYQTQQPVHCILATEAAVWVGTDDGVLKYNRKRGYWRLFTTQDGLLDNKVYAIMLDGDYIWFGTAQGVTRFYWNDPNRID